MENYTIEFDFDDEVIIRDSNNEGINSYSVTKYLKKLRKMARKRQIISYKIERGIITYQAIDRFHAISQYTVYKNQEYLTEVELYMIENILKNANLRENVKSVSPKTATFIKYLKRHYTKEINLIALGASLPMVLFTTFALFIDPMVYYTILMLVASGHIGYGVFSVIHSKIKTNKELASKMHNMPLRDFLASNEAPKLTKENTHEKGKSAANTIKNEIKSLLVEINILLEKLNPELKLEYEKIIKEKMDEYKNNISHILNDGDDSLEFLSLSARLSVFLSITKNEMLKKIDSQNYLNELNDLFPDKPKITVSRRRNKNKKNRK